MRRWFAAGDVTDQDSRIVKISAGRHAKLWPGLNDRGIDAALDTFRKHFPAMNTLHGKPSGPPKFVRDPHSIPSGARSQFIEIPTGFDPTRDFLRLHTTRMYHPTPLGLRLAYGLSYAPLFLSGKEAWQVTAFAELTPGQPSANSGTATS